MGSSLHTTCIQHGQNLPHRGTSAERKRKRQGPADGCNRLTPGSWGIRYRYGPPRGEMRGSGKSIAGEGMSFWDLTAFGLVPYCPCGDVMLSMGRIFLLPLSP
jgi:hypothetical protein